MLGRGSGFLAAGTAPAGAAGALGDRLGTAVLPAAGVGEPGPAAGLAGLTPIAAAGAVAGRADAGVGTGTGPGTLADVALTPCGGTGAAGLFPAAGTADPAGVGLAPTIGPGLAAGAGVAGGAATAGALLAGVAVLAAGLAAGAAGLAAGTLGAPLGVTPVEPAGATGLAAGPAGGPDSGAAAGLLGEGATPGPGIAPPGAAGGLAVVADGVTLPIAAAGGATVAAGGVGAVTLLGPGTEGAGPVGFAVGAVGFAAGVAGVPVLPLAAAAVAVGHSSAARTCGMTPPGRSGQLPGPGARTAVAASTPASLVKAGLGLPPARSTTGGRVGFTGVPEPPGCVSLGNKKYPRARPPATATMPAQIRVPPLLRGGGSVLPSSDQLTKLGCVSPLPRSAA